MSRTMEILCDSELIFIFSYVIHPWSLISFNYLLWTHEPLLNLYLRPTWRQPFLVWNLYVSLETIILLSHHIYR